MIRIALGALLSFLLCAAVMPFVISIAGRMKAKQPILHYVETHMSKSGTPTMGGIGFILATCAICAIFFSGDFSLALISMLVMLGYGIIGFLDDFLKVRFKKNDGLRPYQKIAFQLSIAVIVSLYAYFGAPGDVLVIPFTLVQVHISWWIIPLNIFIFLAFTNSVNLTDGLDGLATSVTSVYVFFFVMLLMLFTGFAPASGQANIILFMSCLFGALIGFLCFNCNPAKIFMGDTGSLALGGALGVTSIFTGMTLSAAIMGIMYVLTSLSVIIQVGWYKRTKKRVFLMAPLHHHFEKKGVPENRIVVVYSAITACIGVAYISVCALLFI